MKSPNIILISIDTLRADHLSCYGYSRGTTPNLDHLAEKGLVFKQAYTTAAWTPPAHASMFTGLYPSSHGVVDQNRLNEITPTIAEVLLDHGYDTAGFINNSQVGGLVGLNRGHDEFDEVWKGISKTEIFKRLFHQARKLAGPTDHGAQNTNKKVLNWLANRWQREKPFYLFIHYIDVHNPYKAPPPFLYKYLSKNLRKQVDMKKIWDISHNPLICIADDLRLNELEKEALICLYDEEISYLDFRIGELLDKLKEMNLLEETALFLTSDHGELFGEHDLYSHVASLYEGTLRVPLIIHYPSEIKQPRSIEEPVQLIDLFPTILDLTNLEKQSENLHQLNGVSLLSNQLDHERPLFAEWEGRIPHFIQNRVKALKNQNTKALKFLSTELRMIRKGDFKLICSSAGKKEMYDLGDDPKEQKNIALSSQWASKVSELEDSLSLWSNSLSDNKHRLGYEMNQAVIENMKNLGYL